MDSHRVLDTVDMANSSFTINYKNGGIMLISKELCILDITL